jgi:polysaccharide biosynthesis/export protein
VLHFKLSSKPRLATWLLIAGAGLALGPAEARSQVAADRPATLMATPPVAAPASRSSAPGVDSRYRLQQGDSFEVNFPFVGSFNQTVTVQRDGYVNLRIVGDVHVIGMSVPEVAEMLRGRYAGILRDPVLTVELRDFEKPYFVAAGELERPGKYDLRGETTLMQAIAIAGGFKAKAKQTNVAVFRRSADSSKAVQVQQINAKRVLEGRQIVHDVALEPGDLVFVSKSHAPDLTLFATIVLPNLGWIAYLIVNNH